jgi:hypothetical protein
MKIFMVCAVEEIIIPRMRKQAPEIATYRRPIRSERAPTKGHMAARESKFARTNQIHLSEPPISP